MIRTAAHVSLARGNNVQSRLEGTVERSGGQPDTARKTNVSRSPNCAPCGKSLSPVLRNSLHNLVRRAPGDLLLVNNTRIMRAVSSLLLHGQGKKKRSFFKLEETRTSCYFVTLPLPSLSLRRRDYEESQRTSIFLFSPSLCDRIIWT